MFCQFEIIVIGKNIMVEKGDFLRLDFFSNQWPVHDKVDLMQMTGN